MLTRVWRAYGQPVAYRGRMLWLVLVLAALLWGMLRPEGPHEPFPFFAVLLHVLAFLALGLTARFAFYGWRGTWIWLPLLLAAPGLEMLQTLLQPESRQFSLLDIGGNVLGVVLAMSLWPWVKEWLSNPGQAAERGGLTPVCSDPVRRRSVPCTRISEMGEALAFGAPAARSRAGSPLQGAGVIVRVTRDG